MSRAGKSKSEHNNNGERRKGKNNMPLAPRSLRRVGKKYMSECTDAQLKKAQVEK